jgi:hypothetical protein
MSRAHLATTSMRAAFSAATRTPGRQHRELREVSPIDRQIYDPPRPHQISHLH